MAVAAVCVAQAASGQTAPTPKFSYTLNVGTVPSYLSKAAVIGTFEGGNPGLAYNTQSSGVNVGNFTLHADQIGKDAIFPGQNNQNRFAIVGKNLAGTVNKGLTFNFTTTGQQVFSFAIGNVSEYMSLSLAFANGTSRSFNGAAVLGLTSSQYGTNGRMTLDMGGLPGITSVTFGVALPSCPGNSQACRNEIKQYRIDDVVAAAPEPATWGLMILGFGVAGVAMRRSRKKVTVAYT